MAQILVVDDDTLLANNVAQALTAAGHSCRAAYTAEVALDTLHQQVDLLILDIMLPGLSGFELCRRVRTSADHFALPILFMSAIDTQEEIEHGLAQGADDFVTKPFHMTSLIRRVETLLQHNGASGLKDPATDLAGPKGIKLEVQRCIGNKQPFDAAYVELLGLVKYGRFYGADERLRAVRHLARMLLACAKDLDAAQFHAGHLGGGHFVCLTAPNTMAGYLKRVARHWNEHVARLVESLTPAKAAPGREAAAAPPELKLLISMTSCTRDTASARQVFEALTHVRQSGLPQGPGIYHDRRG